MRAHYLGGLEPKDIAARDRLSVDTVKSRIQRSRFALRELLERRGFGGELHWAVALLPVASIELARSGGAATSSVAGASGSGAVELTTLK